MTEKRRPADNLYPTSAVKQESQRVDKAGWHQLPGGGWVKDVERPSNWIRRVAAPKQPDTVAGRMFPNSGQKDE